MSIPKAFLALLSERPMNGNQLKTAFESRTGAAWPLNIGQAYTTLQRLERDALIAPAPEYESETFQLTKAGLDAVAAWWQTPVARLHPARDELSIKLTLAATAVGVDVHAVVQAQRTESMRALHEYTALKVGDAKSPDGADLAWRLLLESMIFQTEAEIRWLDHVEASVLRESAPLAPQAAGVPDAAPRPTVVVALPDDVRQAQAEVQLQEATQP